MVKIDTMSLLWESCYCNAAEMATIKYLLIYLYEVCLVYMRDVFVSTRELCVLLINRYKSNTFLKCT